MKIARQGDITSHGGIIISSASHSYSDNQLISRVGDIGICILPDHPTTFVIVNGSSKTTCEVPGVARVGSAVSCGAVIVSGGTWEDNG